jgi:DNA-binding transcriptional MerR regulator
MISDGFYEALDLIEKARRSAATAGLRLYSSHMDREPMSLEQAAKAIHQLGDLKKAAADLEAEINDQQIAAIARALS